MIPDKMVGKVEGVNALDFPVCFSLSVREVKHIRRCLKIYNHYNPSTIDSMSTGLIKNFELFGYRGQDRDMELKRSFREHNENKCAITGCLEKDLTIDHIIPLTDGGKDVRGNLQFLCRKHHEIKNLEWRLELKHRDLEFLKRKIETVKDSLKKPEGLYTSTS